MAAPRVRSSSLTRTPSRSLIGRRWREVTQKKSPLAANFSSGQTSKQGDPLPQLAVRLRSLKINEPVAAACLAPAAADVSLTAPGNPRGPTISRQFHLDCMEQLHRRDTGAHAARPAARKDGAISELQILNFLTTCEKKMSPSGSVLKTGPAKVDRNFALVVFPQAGQQFEL